MLSIAIKVVTPILMFQWIHLFFTVDSPSFFVPIIPMELEAYVNSLLADTTYAELDPAKRSFYAERYYNDYLPYVDDLEQERQQQIFGGEIPKWERSALFAQWIYFNLDAFVGFTLHLPLTGLFLLIVVVFRWEQPREFFRQRVHGIGSFTRPIGWYRISVILLLMCSARGVWIFFRYYPFLWREQFFYLGAMAYALLFSVLFYRYYLREL